jgi:transcriptional regulator with XRE-family HTH domain
MTFGEKLKAYRQNRNLTQAELAKLSNLSQVQISDYERGVTTRRCVRTNNIIALALALKVKPSQLDDDREEENNGRKVENPG